MKLAQRLPATVAEEAREFAAGGHPPAAARPSSTVVLVRDTQVGIQAYVHRRHPDMAFAGGMIAFPGGSVDPADQQPDGTIDAREWAARLDTTEPAAHGIIRSALRETREETGVQLTSADLRPWAHWITPRFQTRRFDTWFFIATVPSGQQPQDVSGETTDVTWIAAHEAITRAELGEWVMLPPTWAVFEELAQYRTVAELPNKPTIDAITPGWIDNGDHVLALLPGDPRYPGDDPGEGE